MKKKGNLKDNYFIRDQTKQYLMYKNQIPSKSQLGDIIIE